MIKYSVMLPAPPGLGNVKNIFFKVCQCTPTILGDIYFKRHGRSVYLPARADMQKRNCWTKWEQNSLAGIIQSSTGT